MINCVPSITFVKSALMTQGPRDIFHGLSCLLASLAGGQSKSLALLQGKTAAANVPFQQVPRFIEVEDNHVRSPVLMEPAFASSPAERSHELDTGNLRKTPISTPFQPMYNDSDHHTTGTWMDRAIFPQDRRPGLPNNESYNTLDAAKFSDHKSPWRLGLNHV